MSRNDFTNPNVLKAETELRYALASYEAEVAGYKVTTNTYTCLLAALNNVEDNIDLQKELQTRCENVFKAMQESATNMLEATKEYNQKLETYKSVIGF